VLTNDPSETKVRIEYEESKSPLQTKQPTITALIKNMASPMMARSPQQAPVAMETGDDDDGEETDEDSELEYMMEDGEIELGEAELRELVPTKMSAADVGLKIPILIPNKEIKPKKKYEKPFYEKMPIECEHCGQFVQGKSNLKSHIRRVHLKQKDHKCTICTKGFWSNNALDSHMLSVHTRRCDSCQEYVVESVPWQDGVDMRMKRDVICTCGAIVSIYSSFGRKRIYIREEDENAQEEDNADEPTRPKSTPGTKYACGTCGKLFMKKSNCERHSRAHSDYKGISCNLCGSSFAYENSLKHHMETEHGVLKNVCKVCGKTYSTDTALRVHMSKFHTNDARSESLIMVMKDGSTGTGNLGEEMQRIMDGEEILEGHIIENDGTLTLNTKQSGEHLVITSRPDGSTEQHIVAGTGLVSSVSGDFTGATGQITMATAEHQLESGQILVTQEGGQLHVTTGDPTLDHESASRIVEQAIRDGHVLAQDGNMSIIIKQMPYSDVTE